MAEEYRGLSENPLKIDASEWAKKMKVIRINYEKATQLTKKMSSKDALITTKSIEPTIQYTDYLGKRLLHDRLWAALESNHQEGQSKTSFKSHPRVKEVGFEGLRQKLSSKPHGKDPVSTIVGAKSRSRERFLELRDHLERPETIKSANDFGTYQSILATMREYVHAEPLLGRLWMLDHLQTRAVSRKNHLCATLLADLYMEGYYSFGNRSRWMLEKAAGDGFIPAKIVHPQLLEHRKSAYSSWVDYFRPRTEVEREFKDRILKSHETAAMLGSHHSQSYMMRYCQDKFTATQESSWQQQAELWFILSDINSEFTCFSCVD